MHATLPDLINLPVEIKEKIYCMHYSKDIDNLQIRNQIYKNNMKIVYPSEVYIL